MRTETRLSGAGNRESMTEMNLTRREWLARATGMLCGGVVLVSLPGSAVSTTPSSITVYKDPSCGCCTKWVAHLQANGFAPQVRDRTDMDALKDSLGIPSALRSCHTAVAGKYLIEGHVPAADVKRLLAAAPPKIVGLAVPGMPSGSPGMEVGGPADRYDVHAFDANGSTHVFARH
jgi:hypothetical protein